MQLQLQLLLLVSVMSAAVSYGHVAFADQVDPYPNVLLPAPPPDQEAQKMIEAHVRELRDLRRTNGVRQVKFRSMWVTQTGTSKTKPPAPAFQVKATDTTTENALEIGSRILHEMVRLMHPVLFKTFAERGITLGIFSRYDDGGPTVFSEFAAYKDRPECAGKCTGACATTCTGDGRKFNTLGGVATLGIGTVIESTILCNSEDPYRGKLNVVVHEMTHVLHHSTNGMTTSHKPGINIFSLINEAYTNAYNKKIWDLDSYAMSNMYEYFAGGGVTFFNTDQFAPTGGMNKCDGVSIESCYNQVQSRARLISKDAPLYNVLSEVFTNQNPNQFSNLRTCMK